MKTAAFFLMLPSMAFALSNQPVSAQTKAVQSALNQAESTNGSTTQSTQTVTRQVRRKKVTTGPQTVIHPAGPQAVKSAQVAQSRQSVKGPQAVKRGPQKPSSTIADRTQMDPTVPASDPNYGTALAKRAPKHSITVNVPSDPGIKAPKFGDWELKAQLRNDLMMANVQELQNVGGKNFGLNNEVRLGLKHKSGWGFSGTASYQTDNFADNSSNKGVTKDASLMVFHPSLYKDNRFDLSGYARVFFPTSEGSRESESRSAAYWSILDITMPAKFSLENGLMYRGFTQAAEVDGTLTSVVYDFLELSHATFKGINFAVGAQGEIDNYNNQLASTEVDLYPFIDFTLIPNVLIEPKYYFPVFVGGSRQVNATGAALDQTQFELFIKLSI